MNNEKTAIRKEGINVNKVNREIYLDLVLVPIFFVLFKKYRLDIFLKIINKKNISKITSIINKSCKLIFEKKNSSGFINDKKVSMLNKVQLRESAIMNLKFFNLSSI